MRSEHQPDTAHLHEARIVVGQACKLLLAQPHQLPEFQGAVPIGVVLLEQLHQLGIALGDAAEGAQDVSLPLRVTSCCAPMSMQQVPVYAA